MMNERIRELGDLADELADEQIDCIGEYHPDWHSVRDQKFAELIARECAEQVDLYFSEFYNGTAEQRILKHFGIEE